MKSWKGHTVIWIFLTVPVFNVFSQYKLLTRGQPSPYDSAVAVRLDQYRKETQKIDLGERLIDSLKAELAAMRIFVIHKDSLTFIDRATILQQARTIDRQQITIDDLNFNIQRVAKLGVASTGKTILGKLFRKPEFWFGAGLITGIIIAK